VVAAFADDVDGLAPVGRDRFVLVEDLRVAEDAVERRAQFVADRRDVAALRQVGLVGRQLGLLQLLVGALVRVDFLHQQARLAVRFLLCDLAALVREDHPPRADAGEEQQRGEGLDEHLLQMR